MAVNTAGTRLLSLLLVQTGIPVEWTTAVRNGDFKMVLPFLMKAFLLPSPVTEFFIAACSKRLCPVMEYSDSYSVLFLAREALPSEF